jgi:dihydropteroate synthase
MILEQWRLNKTLTAEMEESLRKEANYWRQVIERIINVTLMLATSNLAFRGHREYNDDVGTNNANSGNFLSVINLLARYDPVLEKLLSMPQGTVKYLSPTIQNEVISMVARCVKEDILNDIKAAPFSYGGHHPRHQQN